MSLVRDWAELIVRTAEIPSEPEREAFDAAALEAARYILADAPTPERLRAWAEWLSADERKPVTVVLTDPFAGGEWLASYLLRRVADALGEEKSSCS